MDRQQLYFNSQFINIDDPDEYDFGRNFGVDCNENHNCNEIHIFQTGIYRFNVRIEVVFQPNDKTKKLLKRLGGTLNFDLYQRLESSSNLSRVKGRIEVNVNKNSQLTRRSGSSNEDLR